MIERLLDAISPHRCSVCGETGVILCESCKYDIIHEAYSGCLLCHKPCGQRGICVSCRRSLPVEQVWCVGDRQEGLKQILDEYKFNNRRAGARPLAELLDEVVPLLPPEIVVVPIPTLPATVRVRGFDHVGLIARKFAKRRELEMRQLLERRSRATLHFLGKSEREKLGPTLFAAKSGVTMPAHVVLIDDIVTTGTTLRAAVRLLQEAGVGRIDIAVIARQPFD